MYARYQQIHKLSWISMESINISCCWHRGAMTQNIVNLLENSTQLAKNVLKITHCWIFIHTRLGESIVFRVDYKKRILCTVSHSHVLPFLWLRNLTYYIYSKLRTALKHIKETPWIGQEIEILFISAQISLKQLGNIMFLIHTRTLYFVDFLRQKLNTKRAYTTGGNKETDYNLLLRGESIIQNQLVEYSNYKWATNKFCTLDEEPI